MHLCTMRCYSSHITSSNDKAEHNDNIIRQPTLACHKLTAGGKQPIDPSVDDLLRDECDDDCEEHKRDEN